MKNTFKKLKVFIVSFCFIFLSWSYIQPNQFNSLVTNVAKASSSQYTEQWNLQAYAVSQLYDSGNGNFFGYLASGPGVWDVIICMNGQVTTTTTTDSDMYGTYNNLKRARCTNQDTTVHEIWSLQVGAWDQGGYGAYNSAYNSYPYWVVGNNPKKVPIHFYTNDNSGKPIYSSSYGWNNPHTAFKLNYDSSCQGSGTISTTAFNGISFDSSSKCRLYPGSVWAVGMVPGVWTIDGYISTQ